MSYHHRIQDDNAHDSRRPLTVADWDHDGSATTHIEPYDDTRRVSSVPDIATMTDDSFDPTSLGLMVWTIVLLAQKRDVWGTIAATCAFNYDPNIVCFLPALAAYLGGKCLMETREER